MQKFIGMALGLVSILLMASTCGEPPRPLVSCINQKAQAYTIGTQVDGELSITDCVVTEGSTNYVDYYKFTIDKQQDVTFYYQPESYDRSWSLINSEDKAIINNTSNRTQTQQLAAGSYSIAVKAFSANKTGKYVLSTTTPEKGFGGCQTLPKIELGTTKSEELDITDCFILSGLYILDANIRVDYYEFELSQQDDVTIDLRSSELSLNWYLYTRDGNQVIQSFSNTETRQLAQGKYVIAIVGRSETLGQYKVTTTTSTKGFAGCLELQSYTLGATLVGELEITDCQYPNISDYIDYYEFTLSAQTNITFSLAGSATQVQLDLYKRDGTKVGDGPGFQLEVGTYILAVGDNTPFTAAVGAYTLSSTIQ
jgi:hypothetical protein